MRGATGPSPAWGAEAIPGACRSPLAAARVWGRGSFAGSGDVRR